MSAITSGDVGWFLGVITISAVFFNLAVIIMIVNLLGTASAIKQFSTQMALDIGQLKRAVIDIRGELERTP